MRRRHRPVPVEVPGWVRHCVLEHWDPEGDVVAAVLTWLAACTAWEERAGIPAWPAWEGPGRVFGPLPAARLPDVAPPPAGVVEDARERRRYRLPSLRAPE